MRARRHDPRPTHPLVIRALAAGLALASVSLAPGRARAGEAADLTELSLSDLMSVRVSSASKRDEDLLHVSSAIHVISQEDIRRSGADSVMEVLRSVPGMDVARINGAMWAISARGFAGPWANKLLVLVDGRAIYSPLFGGVFWPAEDMPLDDIERIEVIRGPGATLWGSNAVNGVINIITKSAEDTQGTLVDAGVGTGASERLGVRHGGSIGSRTSFRAFAAQASRGSSDLPGGGDAHDWSRSLRAGVRFDVDLDRSDLMLVANTSATPNGRLYFKPVLAAPFSAPESQREEFASSDILARWTHSGAGGIETSVQASYQDFRIRSPVFTTRVGISDVELQQRRSFRSQVLTWGAAVRHSSVASGTGTAIVFDDTSRSDSHASVFVQHETALAGDRVHLTVGSKLERNSFTGVEVQPSVRVAWSVRPEHVVWSALSRAATTPSHMQTSLHIDGAAFPLQDGLVALLTVAGNEDLQSEHVDTLEIGYRGTLAPGVSLDVSTFGSRYRDLLTIDEGVPFMEMAPVPHLVIPSVYGNKARGRSIGADVALSAQATERWRLAGSVSWLDLRVQPEAESMDTRVEGTSRNTPRWQAQVRSSLDLPRHFELDATLGYVGARPASGVASRVRADLRLGWRPSERCELSLSLKDLLEPRHVEFVSLEAVTTSTVSRSVQLGATWRF